MIVARRRVTSDEGGMKVQDLESGREERRHDRFQIQPGLFHVEKSIVLEKNRQPDNAGPMNDGQKVALKKSAKLRIGDDPGRSQRPPGESILGKTMTANGGRTGEISLAITYNFGD